MNAAALVLPHARSSGRLREAPYGAAEACLAGAVVLFLAMLACLLLPTRGDGWVYESTAATTWVKSCFVSAFYLLEVTLLVLAWRGRRPRMIAAPPEQVSGLPALATFWLGFTLLLLIPAWVALAGANARENSREALLLGSMAVVGVLLVVMGTSYMRRVALLRSPPGAPGAGAEPHRHAVLALPEAAFESLRDRPPPGYSFTASRRRAELPSPPPVGFSLTRVQDGTLTPPTFGLLLLYAVSTFVALPAVVLVVRAVL